MQCSSWLWSNFLKWLIVISGAEQRGEASTKIQSGWRGYSARQRDTEVSLRSIMMVLVLWVQRLSSLRDLYRFSWNIQRLRSFLPWNWYRILGLNCKINLSTNLVVQFKFYLKSISILIFLHSYPLPCKTNRINKLKMNGNINFNNNLINKSWLIALFHVLWHIKKRKKNIL